MKIVDANVLLYATNRDAPHHEASVGWLDGALNGDETIGFAWLVVITFLRVSTKESLFDRALDSDTAVSTVERWLAQRPAVVVEPRPGHLNRVRDLLRDVGTAGNVLGDAHLAALALENDAEIVTFDNDFDRFVGVGWHRPST